MGAIPKKIGRDKLRPGVWIKRINKKRETPRPFDLLRVERVSEDRVFYARFDGYEEDGTMRFVRSDSTLIALMYLRRFELADPPAPPQKATPATPVKVPPPPADSTAAELRALREEIRQSRTAICASIDALVTAWGGRRPDASKTNGVHFEVQP